MNKGKHPIFFKSLYGIATIFILGTLLLFRGTKNKNEFIRADGKIIYLDSVYCDLPIRNHGKFRYLQIDNCPRTFELFIGKDFGDFSPEYEQLDKLKSGDNITIYFDVAYTETGQEINRLMQFIDKGSEPFFILGGRDKLGGMLFLVAGLFLLIVVFYLKRTGRIT